MPKAASKLGPAPKYETFLSNDVKDFTCIRILEGEFRNVQYHYDVIKMGKDDGSDSIPLTFTYQVVEDNIDKSQRSRFQDTIASILLDIISTIKGEDNSMENS